MTCTGTRQGHTVNQSTVYTPTNPATHAHYRLHLCPGSPRHRRPRPPLMPFSPSIVVLFRHRLPKPLQSEIDMCLSISILTSSESIYISRFEFAASQVYTTSGFSSRTTMDHVTSLSSRPGSNRSMDDHTWREWWRRVPRCGGWNR